MRLRLVTKPTTVNVREAKTNFSKLLRRVQRREEIIIARAGHPVARLSAIQAKIGRRVPGSAKGLVTITDDFDVPLPADIQRFFEE